MTSIFDILKLDNITLGNVQSVDEMTVIPLVGSNRGNIASPSSLQFESTASYCSITFKNTDDNPAIVPTNFMVRGASAQDHAMSGSGIVAAKTSKEFQNACCIEETQGGYLNAKNNEEDILPIQLRKSLLNREKRSEQNYGKLWDDIKEWIKGLNIRKRSPRSHLRYFYDDQNIKKSLEEFASEFEPVEGQIGAIILLGGVPVGLEIMPSVDHWDTYLKHLISC